MSESHEVAVIFCTWHGRQVTRWSKSNELKAIELHKFFVAHARCRLDVVQIRKPLRAVS